MSPDFLLSKEVEQLVEEIISGYRPRGKVLLILPCSARKPYSNSVSQRLYWRTALTAFPQEEWLERATLSGVYGIVPAEWEKLISDYDFNLNRASYTRGRHKEIIALLAGRVARFLTRHAESFKAVVSYGRERYREVMEIVRQKLYLSHLWVLPEKEVPLRGEGLQQLEKTLRIIYTQINYT